MGTPLHRAIERALAGLRDSRDAHCMERLWNAAAATSGA